MKKHAVFGIALLLTLLTAGLAQAGQDAPWLHIRVTGAGEGGTKVSVNLPLSLIEVVADIAEQEIRRESAHNDLLGEFKDHDISISDIRRAWTELRDAGDAEFVTVEEDDEMVRISRTGDTILIEFEENDGENSGRVEVPVSVVDALLSGDGEELNIRAALDQLVATTSGEIVFVETDDTTVRVWIE